MDYERKYKEALERAKGIHSFSSDIAEIKRMEQIFPELAESDDEKIRKAILNYLIKMWGNSQDDVCGVHVEDAIAWIEKQCEQDDYDDNIITRDDEILQAISVGLTDVAKDAGWSDFGGIPIEDIMDWIEKQGEQRSTDKVEPKFKVGDWVVWQDKCYKVKRNDCRYELIDKDGLSTSLEYGTVDEDAHLWTIQDAKDGEVLACGDWVFIFRKFHINGFPKCHCHYDLTLEEFKVDTDSYMASGGDNYPATKEQRNLLFQKIREAGYEWDREKKELKRIKHKSKCGGEMKFRKFDIITNGKIEYEIRDIQKNQLGDWVYILYNDSIARLLPNDLHLPDGSIRRVCKKVDEQFELKQRMEGQQ